MDSGVNKKHPIYREMEETWTLLEALNGGRKTMIASGTAFLPKEPKESAMAYRVRLNRSFLFPGFSTTLKKLSAKPFSQEVNVTTENDFVVDMMKNMDLAGRNVTQFTRDVFKDCMTYGLSHIMVDLPRRTEMTPESLKAQMETNFRSYFCHVKAKDLINWTTEVVNGETVLASVTISTTEWVNKGFGQEAVERIRIVTRDTVHIHEKAKNGRFTLVEAYNHTFGKVPLFTVYSNRTGFMKARPPLEMLADSNLAHWQSYSDQRNILRIARVPFLVATGFSDEQMDDENGNPMNSEIDNLTNIGPNTLVYSTNSDAKIQWVEHQGNGIEAGERDLQQLKEEMFIQGAQFLMPDKTKRTASEYSGTKGDNESDLQAIVGNMKNALESALTMAVNIMGIDESPSVSIFNDFNISDSDAQEVSHLISMRNANLITHQTFLDEMKRRNVLSDGVVVDDEIDATEDEDDILDNIRDQNIDR